MDCRWWHLLSRASLHLCACPYANTHIQKHASHTFYLGLAALALCILLSGLPVTHTHAYALIPGPPSMNPETHTAPMPPSMNTQTQRHTLHPWVFLYIFPAFLHSIHSHPSISTFFPEHIHRHASWFFFPVLPCITCTYPSYYFPTSLHSASYTLWPSQHSHPIVTYLASLTFLWNSCTFSLGLPLFLAYIYNLSYNITMNRKIKSLKYFEIFQSHSVIIVSSKQITILIHKSASKEWFNKALSNWNKIQIFTEP